MKNSLIIFALLICSLSVKSQNAETYIAQPDLKKFAGIWQYNSGDSTFTIDIKNVKIFVKRGNYYLDVIQGDYTLKKNGVTVQTSIGSTNGIRAGGFIDKRKTQNKISFLLNDVAKNKSGDVIFEINDKNDEAKWTLTNTEGVTIGPYDYSFSIPLHMILKRVK